MYGQIDCDYNQFMWILLPEAFFTRQYGNSETIPVTVLHDSCLLFTAQMTLSR